MKFLGLVKEPILHTIAKFHAIHLLTFEKIGDLLKAPRFLIFIKSPLHSSFVNVRLLAPLETIQARYTCDIEALSAQLG